LLVEEETDILLLQEEEKDCIKKAIDDPISSMRNLLKGSLYLFIQYFWEDYSPKAFCPNWHIEKICNELEQVARRVARGDTNKEDIIFNVPPGSTKTATISIFFPVWCWVNWYWMRFITASHSHPLALESAEYSRDVIRSDRFQELFPEIDIKQDKDTKSNFRVVKRVWVDQTRMPRMLYGGGRVSTSVGAKIRGFHADIIIWDDLVDPKLENLSEAELKAANVFLDHTLSQRKTDRRVSATLGIMQRLDENDPTGHLTRTRKNIRCICLPGEIRTPEYRKKLSPQQWAKYYKDDLLDPVRLNWDVLEKVMNELDDWGFAAQIGQDPTPPGGGLFKVDRIPMIRVEDIPEPIIVDTVRFWDKAGTEGGDGAFSAGVKISKLKSGKFVVWDVRRGRWSAEDREQIIRQTAEADGRKVQQGVEQEPGSGGKESAEATVRNLAGYNAFKECPTRQNSSGKTFCCTS